MTRQIGIFALATALIAVAHAQQTKPHSNSIPPDAQRAYKDIQKTLGTLPEFLKRFPAEGVAGAWQEYKGLELNPKTELSLKTKQLIGLAAASQICRECTDYHSTIGKAAGATQHEMREAVAMASITGHWSTFLNGSMLDEAQWKKETDQILSSAKAKIRAAETGQAAGTEAGADAAAPAADKEISSADQTYQDIERTLGSVPSFLQQFPKEAIAGAWTEMKTVQMNPNTQISPRDKELIGLAVAAQIPCRYCVYFHTQAAKMHGATEQQIKETLAQSALTRHWLTAIHGMDLDQGQLRKDADRIARYVSKLPQQQDIQLGGEEAAPESEE